MDRYGPDYSAVKSLILAGGPAKPSSSQNVNVQMINSLARFRIGIDNGSIPGTVNALFLCHSPDYGHHVAEKSFLLFQVIVERGDMLSGNNKQVNRGLRSDITKNKAIFIFVKNPCGLFMSRYLTKNAPGHPRHPLPVCLKKQFPYRKAKHPEPVNGLVKRKKPE